MVKRGKQVSIIPTHSLASCLYNQFNKFHGMDIRQDVNIENEFYSLIINNIRKPPAKLPIPDDICTFSPSSVSKCSRELYLKFAGYPKDSIPCIPYHNRWTRNSSLVHQGVQKDFLYMEKYLPEADFVIFRGKDNKPMWEENIKTTVINKYKGQDYALTGMMDGQLVYKPTGEIIGFEFKTKSNTIAQVGTYLMKDAVDYHKLQCVAYSLLFGLDNYILMYETLAKDTWSKCEKAKIDIRTFYYHVAQKDKNLLQDKLIGVCKALENGIIPPKNEDKCMFCQFKDACSNL